MGWRVGMVGWGQKLAVAALLLSALQVLGPMPLWLHHCRSPVEQRTSLHCLRCPTRGRLCSGATVSNYCGDTDVEVNGSAPDTGNDS